MSLDFLIVGGGIGGAVLANLLGQAGKRVLVLEKSQTTLPPARPEILWPATVDVLRRLIPRQYDERWMVPIRSGTILYRGRPLLHYGPEVFDAAGVQPCSTANTRELLMQQAPCECQRGIEVMQVLRDRGRVVGVRARDTISGQEREILAGWTVGDDGAHSVIRRGCGLPMTMVQLPIDLLGFGFDWPEVLPRDAVRIWINESRVRSGMVGMPTAPLPEGKGVALIPMFADAFRNEGRVQKALEDFLAQDPLLAEIVGGRSYPRDLTHFHLAWGRKPCFGADGAVLLGDAAHPVTPAGGQGANLAVADALVVAEAALDRPAQLLAEYSRRRSAAARRSLSLSRGVGQIFSLPRPLLNLGLGILPWAARWMNHRPQTFGRALRVAANAFRERSSR